MSMWPRLVGGLWREVNYSDSVNAQRMRPHMPGAVGEGGLIRGGLLYCVVHTVCQVNAVAYSLVLYLQFCLTLNTNFFFFLFVPGRPPPERRPPTPDRRRQRAWPGLGAGRLGAASVGRPRPPHHSAPRQRTHPEPTLARPGGADVPDRGTLAEHQPHPHDDGRHERVQLGRL